MNSLVKQLNKIIDILLNCQNASTNHRHSSSHMKMTPINKIFVIRHGEARNNVERFHNSSNNEEIPPVNLTKSGQNQAEIAASVLLDWVRCGTFYGESVNVYVSPLLRTLQTAERIQQYMQEYGALPNNTRIKVTIFKDYRLKEIGAGNKENTCYSPRTYNGWWDHSDAEDYNGETYTELQIRILSWLTDQYILNKSCVLVSHGTPICVLLFISKVCSNNKTFELLTKNNLNRLNGDLLQNYKVTNGQVTHFDQISLNSLLMYAQKLRKDIFSDKPTISKFI